MQHSRSTAIPRRIALSFALLTGLTAGWASLKWSHSHAEVQEGAGPAQRATRPAPDFRLPKADGTGSIQLSKLKGKPVVLAFGSCT